MTSRLAHLAFYAAAAVALLSVLSGMAGIGRAEAARTGSADPALEQYVLAFYHDIDDGNYAAIARRAVEAHWRKGTAPREYHFAGLESPAEFIRHLENDYGKDGWQIRFLSLDVLGSVRLAGKAELEPTEKREAEIVAYLEAMAGRPLPLGVVTIRGHVSGRCNIVNWRRRVLVADPDGQRIVVSRGAPEDYEPVRREQWFTPVRF